ncbi:hypothetical protein BDK51DRAFT_45008 [Blyttiomyces helicus]|uniref:Uncharacterized protein n=1 Tax=Blyttiomyces helicus TaxID=388810 RepID=A0A4P9VZG1_9FUNG|nr:hypothetical protein BDK51DRAFT_45008 [Blyttiomyces helicus]|eukprot:RKO83740.1 hypothetical protein BDK51DRAFT_45008 [Blyttiomyces helicus]
MAVRTGQTPRILPQTADCPNSEHVWSSEFSALAFQVGGGVGIGHFRWQPHSNTTGNRQRPDHTATPESTRSVRRQPQAAARAPTKDRQGKARRVDSQVSGTPDKAERNPSALSATPPAAPPSNHLSAADPAKMADPTAPAPMDHPSHSPLKRNYFAAARASPFHRAAVRHRLGTADAKKKALSIFIAALAAARLLRRARAAKRKRRLHAAPVRRLTSTALISEPEELQPLLKNVGHPDGRDREEEEGEQEVEEDEDAPVVLKASSSGLTRAFTEALSTAVK